MYIRLLMLIIICCSLPAFAAHDEQFKENFLNGQQEQLQDCLSKSCDNCQDYSCYLEYNSSLQEVLDDDDEYETYNLDKFNTTECELPPWKRKNDSNGRCKETTPTSVDKSDLPPWKR